MERLIGMVYFPMSHPYMMTFGHYKIVFHIVSKRFCNYCSGFCILFDV